MSIRIERAADNALMISVNTRYGGAKLRLQRLLERPPQSPG